MTQPVDTFNYYDMHALSNFKKSMPSNDQQALETVAAQLESVFLNMVLKSMREAEKSFKSELFSSNSSDFYRDMYDNQLALSLSEAKSVGLKEVIVQQLQMQKR